MKTNHSNMKRCSTIQTLRGMGGELNRMMEEKLREREIKREREKESKRAREDEGGKREKKRGRWAECPQFWVLSHRFSVLCPQSSVFSPLSSVLGFHVSLLSLRFSFLSPHSSFFRSLNAIFATTQLVFCSEFLGQGSVLFKAEPTQNPRTLSETQTDALLKWHPSERRWKCANLKKELIPWSSLHFLYFFVGKSPGFFWRKFLIRKFSSEKTGTFAHKKIEKM